MGQIDIFETIGLFWVILTSTYATVEIMYYAYQGFAAKHKLGNNTRRTGKSRSKLPVDWGDGLSRHIEIDR